MERDGSIKIVKLDAHHFEQPLHDEVLVAIWPKSHDIISGAIRFLTRGRGTHAAFIRGNGNIIENFYPHVRERAFSTGERETVEEYRIAGCTPDDWWALERWFDEELRHPAPYSIRDLFRYAFNLPPVSGRQCFCSMWVLRGIRKKLSPCKQPLARLEHEDYASPRDLRISPLLIKRRKPKPARGGLTP